MRGILKRIQDLLQDAGITPAHAGNTVLHGRGHGESGDHPRACGEYLEREASILTLTGSPPRMRGIPVQLIQRAFPQGITPAHAGNTL